MDSGTLGAIITAILGLLGILFGGSGLIFWRSILNALKQSTEVGTALDLLMKTVQDADSDGVWEGGEIDSIKRTSEEFKKQLNEARDAWKNVHGVLMNKILKLR